MRWLIAVSVALLALQARADAPGPIPEEGAQPGSAAEQPKTGEAGATTEQPAPARNAQITAGDASARPAAVAAPTGSMPNLRAREAAQQREQEALRRERELELQAAAIHSSECYRQWGETTCASKLK